MGPVVRKQLSHQEPAICEETENMCNTRQENQQQNHPWQGVYPDLSSLNELFSAPAAVNPEQPSPLIALLASLGLQPIPGAQQEAGPAQDQPSAPPAPQTHDDQAFAGVNQSRQQPSPPHANGHSCGYSCGAPHISQLLQAITSRLIHFSSVATHASFTFFCIMAFLCILSSLFLLLPCLHRLHVRGQPLA